MNTEKTFIGFNKSGKEILVYKKDNNTYINLLSKDNSIYPTNDILLPSLIPYSKVFITFKHNRKNSILKRYKVDRTKTLDTTKIRVGGVYQMYNVTRSIDYEKLEKYTTTNLKIVYPSLFINSFNKWKDILDNKRYFDQAVISSRQFKSGKLVVKITDYNLITANLLEENNRYIEKKKVVELAYKLRNSR